MLSRVRSAVNFAPYLLTTGVLHFGIFFTGHVYLCVFILTGILSECNKNKEQTDYTLLLLLALLADIL